MNEKFMNLAIKEAIKAFENDEVPVGCIIVKDNLVIAKAYNKKEKLHCASKHAEVIAVEKASKKLNNWRLDNCDVYVTLEPCPMCTGAIIQSRIPRVVFGAYDPKGGCMGSCTNLIEVKGFNHYPAIEGGVLQEECASLLKAFFREKRKK